MMIIVRMRLVGLAEVIELIRACVSCTRGPDRLSCRGGLACSKTETDTEKGCKRYENEIQ